MDQAIVSAPTRSYKLACYTNGSREPSFNGVRFKTAAEALKYGADLFSRWTALESYNVVESHEEPESMTIEKGGYYKIQYGNGTQIIYVKDVAPSKRKGGPDKLYILRLYCRTSEYAHWRIASPIKSNDPRLLAQYAPGSLSPAELPRLPS